MRKEIELDVVDISSLQKKIPGGLRDITQEIGFFKPKFLDIPDMLFFVLETDKVPPLTKDFGYAIYPQNEVLFLSVPAQVQAKNYLYYTALFEVLKAKDTPVLHDKKDKHDKKAQKKHEKEHKDSTGEQHTSTNKDGHLYNPVLEAEKKIYDQSKVNNEDRQKFLEARIGFFE
jgi:hypothetical protein